MKEKIFREGCREMSVKRILGSVLVLVMVLTLMPYTDLVAYGETGPTLPGSSYISNNRDNGYAYSLEEAKASQPTYYYQPYNLQFDNSAKTIKFDIMVDPTYGSHVTRFDCVLNASSSSADPTEVSGISNSNVTVYGWGGTPVCFPTNNTQTYASQIKNENVYTITLNTQYFTDIKNTLSVTNPYIWIHFNAANVCYTNSECGDTGFSFNSVACIGRFASIDNFQNATEAHSHSWTYSAAGATLTAKSTCHTDTGCAFYSSGEKSVSLSITAASPTYSGSAKGVTELSGLSAFNSATGNSISMSNVKYWVDSAHTEATTAANSGAAGTNAAPVIPGTYYATLEVGGVKASVAYEIVNGVISSVSFTEPTAPVRDEAPQTTLTVGGSSRYTGTLAWSPTIADNKFASGVSYTATVTLSSNQYWDFASNVTIPSNWTKSASSTLNSLVLTRTYDATAHTHNEVADYGYSASCTTNGLTDGTHCSICGKVFSAQQVIPATGHTLEDDYTIDREATCTTTGSMSKHCLVCGSRNYTRTIPKTGHTEEAIGEYKAATCAEEGMKPGVKCSVCGEIFKEVEIIPKTAHIIFPAGEPKEATCLEEGLTEGAFCGACDALLEEQKVIPKTGHKYSSEFTVDKEATCIAEGSKSRHCTTVGCTAKTDVTVIPKDDHAIATIGEAVDATCIAEGLTEGKKCSVCGTVLEEQKVVEKTAHNYSSEFTVDKEATCIAEGSKSRYCTTEGCTANTDVTVVDKVAHTYAEAYTEDKAATCTAEGSKSRHCTTAGCSARTDVTVIAKTAHKEVKDAAVAATCLESGLTEGTHCSVCNTVLKAQEVIPATGHSFSGNWVTVREPSVGAKGRKEMACSICGTKKYDSIAALTPTSTPIPTDTPVPTSSGKGKNKVTPAPVSSGDGNETPATPTLIPTPTPTPEIEIGNLDKAAEVAPDAPVESATFDNPKSELLAADGLFTEEEKTAIEKGEDAKVFIVIESVDKEEIEQEDQVKIENEAVTELGEDPIVEYMDVSLFKQMGKEEAEKVHEPGVDIQVSIEIPEDMLLTEKGSVRKYRIIRIHENIVETIKGVFNSLTNEFSFKTDKFSTYAIAYSDEKMSIEVDIPEGTGSELKVGSVLKLETKVLPVSDANQKVTFESSDTSVATVDEYGDVTAVGVGTVTISITTADGGVSKDVTLEVAKADANCHCLICKLVGKDKGCIFCAICDAKSKKNYHLCWIWWLILIAILAVIAYVILKRKGRDKKENSEKKDQRKKVIEIIEKIRSKR